MSKYIDGIRFITETCCNCNMAFAMTEAFYNKRRNDHKCFHCPAGHSQYYSGKSEEQKLRDQLTDANNEAYNATQRADVQESIANHIKARVKNGVCPCCNRYFDNVHRHMKSKHKNEFVESARLKLFRNQAGLPQYKIAELIGLPVGYISMYENDKHVPEYAKETIDDFVKDNAL